MAKMNKDYYYYYHDIFAIENIYRKMYIYIYNTSFYLYFILIIIYHEITNAKSEI